MEGNRRLYRQSRDGWLSYLLLFLSAVVIISGLVWRPEGKELLIAQVPSATPIPLNETFDETITQQECTLPSGKWYALQLGAFESEAAAQEVAQRFIRRGAAGYIWEDGRYRTLAAVYPLREDAQNVRRQLEELHSVDTYLYEISLPAIQLRLTGMKGQLEILQASFDHAVDLLSGLQALSVAMDRQEMNTEQAAQSLLAWKEQLSLVELRLRQRFTAPRHAVVDSLLSFIEGYIRFCDELSEGESEVSFGMKLKYQVLDSLNRLKQVYDLLQHT